MLGHIVYKAYYGTFKDYYNAPKKAILFYSSLTNNVDSVKVLNEPVLNWEVSKAGSIIFKLPPCNAGYSKIVCRCPHILLERNGVLIWHGRAISETYDEELNREITCEGALNYLLDTHVKPNDIIRTARYSELLNDLIDEHNRSLEAGDSAIFRKTGWYKLETNGNVVLNDYEIMLNATGSTGWSLGVLSSPSMWKYKNYAGQKIRMTFTAKSFGSAAFSLAYGICLRNSPWTDPSNRITFVERIATSADYDTFAIDTYLGSGGLDGTGHEDAYVSIYLLLSTSAGVSVRISNLKVGFYYDYQEASEKKFPATEGKRTGVRIVPYGEEFPRSVSITDYPTTLDAINDIFINQYGGYLYVDYAKDDGYNSYHPVINYIYGDENEDDIPDDLPIIRDGQNLISLKETTNYESCPTVLIPLGRQKEDWEKALDAPNVSYQGGKYIDKDGYVLNSSDGTYYIAELPVKPYDIYYAYGQGVDDLGLYSIIDGSNNILDHHTFSVNDSSWYQHVEIVIPPNGAKLRVFFKNNSQSSTITSSIFKIQKFNYEDPEEYITLEGYRFGRSGIGEEYLARTDELAGTKFLPIDDMSHIYTYGWIEQVVHFDDVEDQATLLQAANKYCSKLVNAVKTYEAEAADLTPITDSLSYSPIGMPGSYARLKVSRLNIDKILCVTSCSINLRNFAKSTYSLASLPPPDLADLIAKGLY